MTQTPSVSWLDRRAQQTFLAACAHLSEGQLTIQTSGERLVFGRPGGLEALLVVHHPRVFRRALMDGTIGLGEAYMDGDWSTPDLVTLVRLMLRNLQVLARTSGVLTRVSEAVGNVARRLRDNTRDGSRRNIHRHYDLGNDFFRLFLDANLLYSCACFEEADDTLEQAQLRKIERICRKLQLGPDDTAWGGFAAYASTRHGCRVTTTTISREQHDYAAALFRGLGEAGDRITLLQQDYRDLQGRFSKIVSIEMFEAVGFAHYDEFFGALERLLAPDGSALLQFISVDDQRFKDYLAAPDWIEKYIFPGGELGAVGPMLESVSRVTTMTPIHLDSIGLHYARTLHAWRERFWTRIDDVRAQGYDERFVRMWDLYLAYCEGGFAERYIGDYQLLLTRQFNRSDVYGDPPRAVGTTSGVSSPATVFA